jgi:hypothetical protein
MRSPCDGLRSGKLAGRAHSVAANLVAILGGIVVFHEPIGSGSFEIGARFLAFCLVIAGAALMPAPMRATDAASTPSRATSQSDAA